MRAIRITIAMVVALVSLGTGAAPASEPASKDPAASAAEAPIEKGAPSAILLFAKVEEAWAISDAERLASLVDTTRVRIALKTGAPLTAAITRVAAVFLLQDQLRLVQTRGFQIQRFDCDAKRGTCRGTALWSGDWGGRQGNRVVRVALTARRTDRWLLTEIRAED